MFSDVDYSWFPITRTLANSNRSRFPLDILQTFTIILPSVTQTLDNLNLPLTRSNFWFPLSVHNSNHVISAWQVEIKSRALNSEILNLFQNKSVNSLSYFFVTPVQIQCPSLHINQALLLNCISSPSICLFPVICFELPITGTFFRVIVSRYIQGSQKN